MMGANVGYDLWFVAHLMLAVAAVVVLGALRYSATLSLTDTDRGRVAKRFPNRVNWAARLIHLVPCTGLVLSGIGGHDVSLSRPWVLTGLVLYVVLAYVVEARVLPVERQVAEIVRDPSQEFTSTVRRLVRVLDSALLIMTITFAVMVSQF